MKKEEIDLPIRRINKEFMTIFRDLEMKQSVPFHQICGFGIRFDAYLLNLLTKSLGVAVIA